MSSEENQKKTVSIAICTIAYTFQIKDVVSGSVPQNIKDLARQGIEMINSKTTTTKDLLEVLEKLMLAVDEQRKLSNKVFPNGGIIYN
jgi:hypothetical protein